MQEDLRSELKQNRPFQTLEQEAYLSVLRTAAVLTDDLELLFKPLGITLAQYNVLRILRGSEADGLCRNELRNRMLTRMPDVTRLLDRMEQAGLVNRSREAEDRRLVTTRITARGMELLDDLDAPVAEEHRRRFGSLSQERLGSLIELLSVVRQSS